VSEEEVKVMGGVRVWGSFGGGSGRGSSSSNIWPSHSTSPTGGARNCLTEDWLNNEPANHLLGITPCGCS
jgi:hypothetical protein